MVIAIIGLLASIVAVAVNKTRLKARNAKRNSDAKTLTNAFSMVMDIGGGSLPDSGGTFACVSKTSCDGAWSIFSSVPAVSGAISPYLSSLPSDPVGGSRGVSGIIYNSNWDGSLAGSGGCSPLSVPAGAYIHYAIELGGDCASGTVVSCGGYPNTKFCILKLD